MLFPFSLRRERDSNPRRCYPQRFSRPPQSTTLPSLLLIDTLPCFSKAMQRYGLFSYCPNIFATFLKIFFVVFVICWDVVCCIFSCEISSQIVMPVIYLLTCAILSLGNYYTCRVFIHVDINESGAPLGAHRSLRLCDLFLIC